MYCNYCDSHHRNTFTIPQYACNSTYDSVSLTRCDSDLYSSDNYNWSYEDYMDYYCDNLYDSSKYTGCYTGH